MVRGSTFAASVPAYRGRVRGRGVSMYLSGKAGIQLDEQPTRSDGSTRSGIEAAGGGQK